MIPKYRYHPMHMHLHTCFQGGASMESQIYNANKLGMQYIRLTDHDSTLGRAHTPVMDFSLHQLEYTDPNGRKVRFDALEDTELSFEGDALRISARKAGGMQLWTKKHWHMISLLARPQLELGVRVLSGEAKLVLSFSQRPPHMIPAKMEFPLTAEQQDYSFDMAALVPEELGGQDNALTDIVISVSEGTVLVDRLELSCEHEPQEMWEKQKTVAERIGKRYGVKPFVGYELSMAGEHKNSLCGHVPIFRYDAVQTKKTDREGAEHILRHGGIFSYNHPLMHLKTLHGKQLPAEERENAVRAYASHLIASRVYGASVVEVGFPEGRGEGITLEHYLQLWDMLSLAGIFITGDGSSDSHDSTRGWFEGNNFATWVAAEESLEFPIAEEEFNNSLVAGRAYTGDPVKWMGNLEFTSEGLPMGAIHGYRDGEKKPFAFRFAADSLHPGWKVRAVRDGMELFQKEMDTETVELSFEATPVHTVSFVRMEVYDENGRCVLLTNPVYMVNLDTFRGSIPEERTYGRM